MTSHSLGRLADSPAELAAALGFGTGPARSRLAALRRPPVRSVHEEGGAGANAGGEGRASAGRCCRLETEEVLKESQAEHRKEDHAALRRDEVSTEVECLP